MDFLLASDFHGDCGRYGALWAACSQTPPDAVFLAGDLLPPGTWRGGGEEFVAEVLAPGFRRLRECLGVGYPAVFLIPGNDDPRVEWEAAMPPGEADGLWVDVHDRVVQWRGFSVLGYACVPLTPFLLKDWERYDVSRGVDVGCTPPEEGCYTVPVTPDDMARTIEQDLEELVAAAPAGPVVGLFHAPPYRTCIDRAALDGVHVDHAPVDVHVGSIAVRRFVETRRPLATLHGHVHESPRITGSWLDRVGGSVCLSGAHDGPELALVRFDPARPDGAVRELRPPSPPVRTSPVFSTLASDSGSSGPPSEPGQVRGRGVVSPGGLGGAPAPLLGLCPHCEHGPLCRLSSREGGVWFCEEYE